MKQAVVVRRDLRMRRAEVASYVAKASSRFLYDNREKSPDDHLIVPFSHEESEWFYGNQKVIVLGVQSEADLKKIIDRAEVQGLTVSVMERHEDEKMGQDYSPICAAIGPHDDDTIDAITGGLRLM